MTSRSSGSRPRSQASHGTAARSERPTPPGWRTDAEVRPGGGRTGPGRDLRPGDGAGAQLGRPRRLDSLRALQTPFLLTATSCVDEVVTSDLAEPLIGGAAGGTACMGSRCGRRRCATRSGTGTPAGLEDFRGAGIRAPYSRDVYALADRALGSPPVDLAAAAMNAALRRRTARRRGERRSTSFAFGPPATITADVTLYAKIDTHRRQRRALGRARGDQAHGARRRPSRDPGLAGRQPSCATTSSRPGLRERVRRRPRRRRGRREDRARGRAGGRGAALPTPSWADRRGDRGS